MIQVLYLGRVEYGEGLRLQAEVEAWHYAGRVGNVLLLLEHPPVLTLGRNTDRSNVLASDELLAQRGITIFPINRGGDVTYHGPGQLVGYPIFDLRSMRTEKGNRMGPVDFVRRMEEALIRVCGSYGVRAGLVSGLTGVWCPGSADSSRAARLGALDSSGNSAAGQNSIEEPLAAEPERKIAAIGIHVSRGITSHGFAFNVTTDLRDFQLINPCGITDKPVTSLELEVRRTAKPIEAFPSLEAVAHEAARQFGMVFGEPMLAMENYAALRAQAENAPPAQFPAQDTPLRVPDEVGLLLGRREKPGAC